MTFLIDGHAWVLPKFSAARCGSAEADDHQKGFAGIRCHELARFLGHERATSARMPAFSGASSASKDSADSGSDVFLADQCGRVAGGLQHLEAVVRTQGASSVGCERRAPRLRYMPLLCEYKPL